MRNVLLGVFLGALVLWFLPGPAHAAGALVLAAVLPGALLGALIERTRPLGIGPLGTVVASVSLTYVVGMAVNAVAALFGTAFTATWSLIGQALLIAVLLGICWWRLPRRIAVAIPAFPVRTALGLAALALLPLAAVGAASWLNNTGSSLGPLFVLAAVVVACAFAWLRPGSPLMLPALYASALAVMLLGAWRGDHFSGIDQSKEFFLADLVTRTGHWTPGLSIDAYNSSLGVTILPVHLSHLFGVDLSTAFRLLIPAGYALVPVLIASLYRHVRAPRIGVLAAFLFLAQPAFVDWGPVPVRQMVAFLFFAAAIRIMFDREAPARLRNVGLLATGALLILSHYSTAYLTLPLLVIGTVLAQIAQRRLRGRSSEPVLRANWAVLGLLVVFAVVWLGPITGVSSNLAETSRSSARVLSTTGFSPFGSVGYAPGTGLADQLGLGPQTQPRDEVFEDYQDYAEAKAGEIGIRPLTPREDAGPIWLLPADERPAEQTWWGSILLVLETVVKQMMRLLLAVGLVVVVVRFIRGRLPLPGLSSYAVAAGTLLGLVVVVPVASIAYDVGRT
ncbi:MAG: hypothetical protein Q4F67_08050, partial [Propionibacteriaceae bacterium]|nr:hypothetical protein [Propionibacteriaceae bacterium]